VDGEVVPVRTFDDPPVVHVLVAVARHLGSMLKLIKYFGPKMDIKLDNLDLSLNFLILS
jgi:hypothetical protein